MTLLSGNDDELSRLDARRDGALVGEGGGEGQPRLLLILVQPPLRLFLVL